VKAIRNKLALAVVAAGQPKDTHAPPATAHVSNQAAPPPTPSGSGSPADETTTINLNHAGGDTYDKIAEAARAGKINVRTGWPDLDKKILHKLENPELAIYKLQNGAYKLAFLLAPISLPFVWLLFFWKRGMTLFDHTVFILYSLSFVSLLFIVLSLISMLPAVSEFVALLILAIPLHFYFHLKGSYSLGWFSALWRLPLLIMFSVLSLTLFLLAILAVGFVG